MKSLQRQLMKSPTYTTAIAAGKTPDTGGISSDWAATLLGMGGIVALDDWYNEWEGSETMAPSMIDNVRSLASDGKLYMLPKSTNFTTLWINDQMFADAGLEAPATWDDFFAAAEKLTDKEKGQYGYLFIFLIV